LIISDRFGFAFVHIPKCAGTSVRSLLGPFDDYEGRFWGIRPDADGVTLDWAHLPLNVLRERFPDAFADLRAVESFAIVRDPMDRFVSSMNEMLRNNYKTSVTEQSDAEIARAIDDVMETLRSTPDPLPPKYVHFTPQSRYVSLDGERVVTHLFGMGEIDLLQRRLSERAGVELPEVPRLNARRNVRNLTFRNAAVEKAVWRVNDFVWKNTPGPVFRFMRDVAKPLVLSRKGKSGADRLREHPKTRPFLEEFYGKDIELHAAVRSGPEPVRDGAEGASARDRAKLS
jgi:hypothetical protein